MAKQLTICYFGTYRSEYSRNKILIKALRSANVNFIECHVDLWHGIEDRVQAVKRGLLNPSLCKRILKAYFQLLREYRSISHYDVMIIGYPGQFDVFLARILTWLRGKKLIWDVFMSIHLISLERGLDIVNPTSVKLLKLFENVALKLPDQLIIDTQSYREWFYVTYKVAPKKFWLIPTGADEDIFVPAEENNQPNTDKFTVLYYGTFIPNHGVALIIKAANLLRQQSKIKFILVGDGPERPAAIEKITELNLGNIELVEWMDQPTLKNIIAQSDLCLGAFGQTPQSMMTVQNKIYECLAMKKPVLTGESAAIRMQFSHMDNLYITDRDPVSIANGIQDLFENLPLLRQIADNGYTTFKDHYSTERIGVMLGGSIQNLVFQEKRCND